MTWRLRAGPGSFRDVPFFVSSDQLAGGRKVVVHEYPLRDTTFIEDLGEAGRAISVDAYVIGDDYIQRRDALIDAFATAGPGKLRLPYLNLENKSYVVSRWTAGTSRDEGGLCPIQIEFLETAPDALFPMELPDLMGGVDDRVKDLLDASQSALPVAVNTAGQPSAFLKSLSSVVRGAAGAINSALARVNTAVGAVTGPLDTATQFAADLKSQLDGIILDADSLVRSPFVAADRFRDVFDSLFESPALPPRNLDALLEAYEFDSDIEKPAPVTSNRAREASNYDALQLMIQRMVVASAARFAPRCDFETFEDAVAARERITTLLDEQIEVAEDDLLPALTDLRAALVQAVPGTDSDLPRLLTFTPPTTLPSLVVAHRVYGSVDRELEIVARNRIRHPGFVLGGRELQVLSDA